MLINRGPTSPFLPHIPTSCDLNSQYPPSQLPTICSWEYTKARFPYLIYLSASSSNTLLPSSWKCLVWWYVLWTFKLFHLTSATNAFSFRSSLLVWVYMLSLTLAISFLPLQLIFNLPSHLERSKLRKRKGRMEGGAIYQETPECPSRTPLISWLYPNPPYIGNK